MKEGSLRSRSFIRLIAMMAIMLICVAVIPPADAGSVGKSLGKAATKSVTKRIGQKAVIARQKMGKLYQFQKPRTLIHWSKRPTVDVAKGLPAKHKGGPHVFAQYPKVGRKFSAPEAQKRLNIPHKVKCYEKIRVPAGQKYHARPIKGGARGEKEIILHGQVPRRWIGGGSCFRK